jgi:hypothetical protein
MLVDRYPAEDVFARVPELANQTDPLRLFAARVCRERMARCSFGKRTACGTTYCNSMVRPRMICCRLSKPNCTEY